MKLRCWPGCLARISERCTVVDIRGKIIECDKLILPGDPPPEAPWGKKAVHDDGEQTGAEWTYKGPRLYAWARDFNQMAELHSIEDAVLDPLLPPPGTIVTETSDDAPIITKEAEHA